MTVGLTVTARDQQGNSTTTQTSFEVARAAAPLGAMNISGYEYGSGAPFAGAARSGWRAPLLDPYTVLSAAGIKLVRLPLAWANLEPTAPTSGHNWNQAYLASVDDTVERFAAVGIDVIYTFHQNDWTPAIRIGTGSGSYPGGGIPTWLYPGIPTTTSSCTLKQDWFTGKHGWTQAVDAHAFLAAHFVAHPNVIGCDLFNEPYACSGLAKSAMNLQEMYERFGQAVHQENPSLLLVIEDARTCADPATYALQAKPDLPNLVYSPHVYCPWSVGQQFTADHLERAASWGAQCWIGEFSGLGQNAAVGDTDLTSTQAAEMAQMFDWCRANGVSWAYWAYTAPNGLMRKVDGAAKPQLLATLKGGL